MTTENPKDAIRLAAINRAIGWLGAAGVDFAVIMPDGTKAGTLEIMPKKGKPRTKVHDFDKNLGYVKIMRAMQVGDVESWTVPPEQGAALRSCVASTAIRYWGSGSHETTVKDGVVTTMRCS